MSADVSTSTSGTFAELLKRLGDVPLDRIRTPPAPGTATEADVVAARALPQRRLCELVDGVLVEKAMGTREALLATMIATWLTVHVRERKLGIVLGADGMLRLLPGLVRIPDVSFIPWERIPGAAVDSTPIASYAPDLAVEVLSPSNTPGEIRRKLRDYFLTGTRLVWVIQTARGTARVYTAPDQYEQIPATGTLDASPVLPGLTVSLPDLFACTRRDPPAE